MRNALLIAWREFWENARTKGFWLSLLILPLTLFLVTQAAVLLERKGTPTRYFVLVDASGELEPPLALAFERSQQQRVLQALREYGQEHLATEVARTRLATRLAAAQRLEPAAWRAQGGATALAAEFRDSFRTNAPPFREPSPRFQRVPLPEGVTPGAGVEELAQALRPYLRGERRIQADGGSQPLFAAVLIPAGILDTVPVPGAPRVAAVGAGEPRGLEYWSQNVADTALREEVERVVNHEVRLRAYRARGLDVNLIRQIEALSAPVVSLDPKKAEGQERVGLADRIRQWAPSAFVYLLWIGVFAISQMLLNNTIEEKSNRIIEVLLSSVTPGELMLGKLLGIAAVGLTMILAWVGSLTGVVLWKAAGAGAGGAAGEVTAAVLTVMRSTPLLPAFVVYFLLGYLLYAGIILAIGSTCNTLKDAQNYMGVIVLLLMVPLMTMMFIPRDPNGTIATVLSWIPLYTPFVMMNRITADPPWRDLIGTTLLLLAFTGLVLWLAGRIFRLGILRTGQPPRLRDLWRWLRER